MKRRGVGGFYREGEREETSCRKEGKEEDGVRDKIMVPLRAVS